MALFTDKINIAYTGNGASVTQNVQTISGDAHAGFDNLIPDGVTAGEILVAFPFATIKSCIIHSDQAVTLKTNSSSDPDDTITLGADQPHVYYTGSPYTNPFTADVTSMFVANASGKYAHVQLRVLFDSTPVLADVAKIP